MKRIRILSRRKPHSSEFIAFARFLFGGWVGLLLRKRLAGILDSELAKNQDALPAVENEVRNRLQNILLRYSEADVLDHWWVGGIFDRGTPRELHISCKYQCPGSAKCFRISGKCYQIPWKKQLNCHLLRFLSYLPTGK